MNWYYAREGQQVGPFDSPQLKQLATSGQLRPSDLVWREGMAQWVPATQIKGLFAEATAIPPPVPPALPPNVAVAPVSNPIVSEHPVPGSNAPAMAYATPASLAAAGSTFEAAIRRRSALPFTIVAAMMFIVGLVVAYEAYFGRTARMDVKQMITAAAATCGFLLLAIPALILWLIWVHAIHRDLRNLSGGQYSISPGGAVGMSFIPVFDAFWVVYMPWRACGELNQHLRSRGLATVSAGSVMGCQIGSIVCAFALPGALPLLYAASMWQIQAGVNRLCSR